MFKTPAYWRLHTVFACAAFGVVMALAIAGVLPLPLVTLTMVNLFVGLIGFNVTKSTAQAKGELGAARRKIILDLAADQRALKMELRKLDRHSDGYAHLHLRLTKRLRKVQAELQRATTELKRAEPGAELPAPEPQPEPKSTRVFDPATELEKELMVGPSAHWVAAQDTISRIGRELDQIEQARRRAEQDEARARYAAAVAESVRLAAEAEERRLAALSPEDRAREEEWAAFGGPPARLEPAEVREIHERITANGDELPKRQDWAPKPVRGRYSPGGRIAAGAITGDQISTSQTVDGLVKLVEMGIYSINEARQILLLEPLDDDDSTMIELRSFGLAEPVHRIQSCDRYPGHRIYTREETDLPKNSDVTFWPHGLHWHTDDWRMP